MTLHTEILASAVPVSQVGTPAQAAPVRIAYVSYWTHDQVMVEGLTFQGAQVTTVSQAIGLGGANTPRPTLPARLARRISFVVRSALWLRQNRGEIDVAMAGDNRTAGAAASVGRLIGGPPVIVQLGGPRHSVRLPALRGRFWRSRARVALERLAALFEDQVADAVGAASFAAGRRSAERAGQVAVIPWSGVDLEIFRPIPRNEARRRLGLPLATPVVLGRADEAGNTDADCFVRAAVLVGQMQPDVAVAFIGRGLDDMRRLARGSGLDLFGQAITTAEERALWCAAADVVVQAVSGEGLALPVLEALSVGTPVAATAADGLTEALDNGRVGTLTAEGDSRALAEAIEAHLRDPSAAEMALTKGREHVKSLFAASDAFADWVGLARLVAGRGRDRRTGPTGGCLGSAEEQERLPTVALLTPAAAPGGAERALSSLASEMRKRGFNAHAVLLERGPVQRWMEESGCRVSVIPVPRSRFGQLATFVPAVIRLAWLLRRSGCQAIVSNHAKGHIFGGSAAALARLPAVFWQQGVPTTRLAERIAGRVPAKAIVGSCEVAVEAQRRLAPRGHVVKVHLGTDVARISARSGSGASIRRELVDEGEVLIGIVGRLERWKGQHVFVEAAARLASMRPEVHFAVIGGAVMGWEGAYEDELHDMARRLRLHDRITFTGHQTDPVACADALDVVVHASIEPEAFGLVIVEAMALGKPVIATAAGGPLEIVEDGVSGLLTVPGDVEALAGAMDRLAGDPGLRRTLGDAARQRAQRFTQGRMAGELLQLL